MFETVYGHARQKAILERQLKKGTLSHAYLFTGVEGSGKRKLAEDFAIEIVRDGLEEERPITLNHPDILRTGYSEENIGIGEVRKIIETIKVSPLEGENRVFLIDHADRMNPIAQNALLKTLEEPQPGNVFILISDNPAKILETIQSRCQSVPFKDISVQEKKALLQKLGISYSGDLTRSVGEILRSLENPEAGEQNGRYYQRLKRVMQGDALEALRLAKDIAETNQTEEILLFFIRNLYTELLDSEDTVYALETLFDLYDKLAYNVNLRLQLESSLVKISMEHNNGKEYSWSQVS